MTPSHENIDAATTFLRRDRTIYAVTTTLLSLMEHEMNNLLMSCKTALECIKLLQENAVIFLSRLVPLLITAQHLYPGGIHL